MHAFDRQTDGRTDRQNSHRYTATAFHAARYKCVLRLIFAFEFCFVNTVQQLFHIVMLQCNCRCFVSDSPDRPKCNGKVGFWTAGQRIDPSTETPFVWKPMTSDGQQQLEMNYTNWKAGQPDYHKGRESCMHVWSDYLWNDAQCSGTFCYLCEYDIVIAWAWPSASDGTSQLRIFS